MLKSSSKAIHGFQAVIELRHFFDEYALDRVLSHWESIQHVNQLPLNACEEIRHRICCLHTGFAHRHIQIGRIALTIPMQIFALEGKGIHKL